MQRDLSRLPVVNSLYLFQRLVDFHEAKLVCDVGSFDGAHAVSFVRAGTRVVALEANPKNAQALSLNKRVAGAGVDVFQLAAWHKDETVAFYVVDVPTGHSYEWANKISSMRTRSDGDFESQQVMIDATRLDSFVSRLNRQVPASIALWIDVEGVGFEVLEGISGIRDAVSAIHIEVETRSFWDGQHLWPDILTLMDRFGFSAVARSNGEFQCNVVFINNTFRQKSPFKERCLILLARVVLQTAGARRRLRRVLWRK